MDSLVMASHNQHKIDEIKAMLKGLPLALTSSKELNIPSPQETAPTFVENALIKARFASRQSGLPALADDSGLVVPALGGQPGVISARYAGEQASDADNYTKLLQKMSALTGQSRRAFFYCVIVYLEHDLDPCPKIFTGQWEGQVLLHAQKGRAFGYDPVFYCPTLKQAACVLSIVEKNKCSHRAKAMIGLVEFFRDKSGSN